MNQQFHAIIYDVCPNRAATDLLLRLKAQMRKYNGKTILVPNRDTRSHMEHRAILEAIKRRDPIQAEAKVRAHVESVRQTFDDYFSLLF